MNHSSPFNWSHQGHVLLICYVMWYESSYLVTHALPDISSDIPQLMVLHLSFECLDKSSIIYLEIWFCFRKISHVKFECEIGMILCMVLYLLLTKHITKRYFWSTNEKCVIRDKKYILIKKSKGQRSSSKPNTSRTCPNMPSLLLKQYNGII